MVFTAVHEPAAVAVAADKLGRFTTICVHVLPVYEYKQALFVCIILDRGCPSRNGIERRRLGAKA